MTGLPTRSPTRSCQAGQRPPRPDPPKSHLPSWEKWIELDASTSFLVYFWGVVPGFAYLGELPEALVTPRLAAPRKKVPAGSVGIARNQTGVYPFETPGGWRLIGRTPMAMFRTDRDGLSLLAIGNRLRFVPVSLGPF